MVGAMDGAAHQGRIEGAGLQRARGRASVRLAGGVLRDLHQAGSGKAMLPRTHGSTPEVVFLNTAGGLTGGDAFEQSLALDSGEAVGTTQAAERVYRSAGGAAEVTTRLEIGPGARLDWLPQETIAFEGACLRRRTVARLGEGASLLLCEMLVLGRAAMGERVVRCDLLDRREVWRGERLIWAEPLRVTTEVLARGSQALLGGARAIATLLLVGRGAQDALPALRAPHEGVEAAASAWDGRAVLRMRAMGASPLRRAVARVILALRGRLPHVWPSEPA